MNQRILCLFLAFTLGALASSALRSEPVADQAQQPKITADIDDLLKQRRDCLADAMEARLAEFRGGLTSVHPVIYLNDQLLEAELEVARKQELRRRAYVTYLSVARDLERLARASLNIGTGTRQEMLAAKAQRLLAEIRILRLDEAFLPAEE